MIVLMQLDCCGDQACYRAKVRQTVVSRKKGVSNLNWPRVGNRGFDTHHFKILSLVFRSCSEYDVVSTFLICPYLRSISIETKKER